MPLASVGTCTHMHILIHIHTELKVYFFFLMSRLGKILSLINFMTCEIFFHLVSHFSFENA